MSSRPWVKIVKKIAVFLVIFVAGATVGWLFSNNAYNKLLTRGFNRVPLRQKGDFTYISPLLLCRDLPQAYYPQLNSIRDDVSKIIDDATKKNTTNSISVYFKDLSSSQWFGINTKEKYAPASLLKVPLMIAYYKLAESDPSLLSKRITVLFTEDANRVEYFKSIDGIKSGKSYTIDDLIKYMIINSDNNAYDILTNNAFVSQDSLIDIYRDLGIPPPTVDPPDFISVPQYSYFFRILYNASYINQASSEKALELLSKVDFPHGIRLALPSDLSFANKFGERFFNNANGTPILLELHDCGIVYYSNNPYLLCIMTRGNNLDNLSKTISTISATVYKDYDALKKSLQPPSA